MISDEEFKHYIKSGNYSSFQIIAIGFSNASGQFLKFDKDAQNWFFEFRRKGGKFLFFHDVFDRIPEEKIFFPFTTIIGNITFYRDYPIYDSVQFTPKGKVLNNPFHLPDVIPIVGTHRTFTYGKMEPLLTFCGNQSHCYCQRSQDSGHSIYICEAYHSPSITEFEEKLIYNIIVGIHEGQ